MRITLKSAISIAIFIAIYTGFQGGRYFLDNGIQEIGLLCPMILFIYGAIMSALTIRTPDLRWSWWVFSTLFFGLCLLSSCTTFFCQRGRRHRSQFIRIP